MGFCDGAVSFVSSSVSAGSEREVTHVVSLQGKCMKQVQDVIERLWDFIDKLDINTFGKFLADNIVGSVVAFSLLFWVPFSILVHCVVGLRTVLRSCQRFSLPLNVLTLGLFVCPGQEAGPAV